MLCVRFFDIPELVSIIHALFVQKNASTGQIFDLVRDLSAGYNENEQTEQTKHKGGTNMKKRTMTDTII